MKINHPVVGKIPDDPEAEINNDEWAADHTVVLEADENLITDAERAIISNAKVVSVSIVPHPDTVYTTWDPTTDYAAIAPTTIVYAGQRWASTITAVIGTPPAVPDWNIVAGFDGILGYDKYNPYILGTSNEDTLNVASSAGALFILIPAGHATKDVTINKSGSDILYIGLDTGVLEVSKAYTLTTFLSLTGWVIVPDGGFQVLTSPAQDYWSIKIPGSEGPDAPFNTSWKGSYDSFEGYAERYTLNSARYTDLGTLRGSEDAGTLHYHSQLIEYTSHPAPHATRILHYRMNDGVTDGIYYLYPDGRLITIDEVIL